MAPGIHLVVDQRRSISLVSIQDEKYIHTFTKIEVRETIASRAANKWGGVMIKLSGLSPCLLYSAFYFNSVVCRLLSVSHQEFKQHQWLSLQQRAHNPAYTNQPLPRQIQILNLTVGFFSQTHVSQSGGVIKNI